MCSGAVLQDMVGGFRGVAFGSAELVLVGPPSCCSGSGGNARMQLIKSRPERNRVGSLIHTSLSVFPIVVNVLGGSEVPNVRLWWGRHLSQLSSSLIRWKLVSPRCGRVRLSSHCLLRSSTVHLMLGIPSPPSDTAVWYMAVRQSPGKTNQALLGPPMLSDPRETLW